MMGNSWGDPGLWLAIVGAAIFKVVTSARLTVTQRLASFCAAVFFAWLLTDPTVHYLELDYERWGKVVAAVITLTGESFARVLMTAAADPLKTLDTFMKIRRGEQP